MTAAPVPRFRPWAWAFVLGVAAVSVLSLLPASLSGQPAGMDKLLHAAAFAALAWLACMARPTPCPPPRWQLGLWLVAWGLWIELAQSLTLTRHAEALDLAADAAGTVAGLVAHAFVRLPGLTRPPG